MSQFALPEGIASSAGVVDRDPVELSARRRVLRRRVGVVAVQLHPLAAPTVRAGERGQPRDALAERLRDGPGAVQVSAALVVDVVADHAAPTRPVMST